jgi:hypothetical protein
MSLRSTQSSVTPKENEAMSQSRRKAAKKTTSKKRQIAQTKAAEQSPETAAAVLIPQSGTQDASGAAKAPP